MLNAVYPGTFDPLTNGHLDLIARASRIFPKVYVGVATSAGKHPLLSLEERLYCARLVCADFANVEPLPVTGLLKDFVMSHDVGVIVRGARAVSDFEYEFQMAGMNRQLMPEVETVFMTPSLQNQFVRVRLCVKLLVLAVMKRRLSLILVSGRYCSRRPDATQCNT